MNTNLAIAKDVSDTVESTALIVPEDEIAALLIAKCSEDQVDETVPIDIGSEQLFGVFISTEPRWQHLGDRKGSIALAYVDFQDSNVVRVIIKEGDPYGICHLVVIEVGVMIGIELNAANSPGQECGGGNRMK